MKVNWCLTILCILTFHLNTSYSWTKFNSFSTKKRSDLRKRCPNVRPIRNFNFESVMGFWYVVQYYSSTEDSPEYGCMRNVFSYSHEDRQIMMNFSYVYTEDPLREKLQGNITWIVPDFDTSAHWIHSENFYEGIYNTYVLDTDAQSWALIMHCAEKKKHPRYLSALLISRTPELGNNVVNYLREKLPRYDIDISFMFPIDQTNCDNLMESSQNDPLAYVINGRKNAKNNFNVILKHN